MSAPISRAHRAGLALASAVLALLACRPPTDGANDSGTNDGVVWLVDESDARGLNFTWESGVRGSLLMPEIIGGGAALIDVDADGDLDAYLVQCGSLRAAPETRPSNRLYLNDGAGRFEDGTKNSGADDRGIGMGVATADADGDGSVDLLVTNVGPNVLLLNDGAGRFRDATRTSGVGHAGFSTSASFADLDLDGDLDLYVTNYLHWAANVEIPCTNQSGGVDYCDPQTYEAPAIDALYENLGDGTFRDVTESAGVSAVGCGLGVVAGDFDDDGRVDLFVANDGMPDFLWVNETTDGGLSFTDQAFERGCAVDGHGAAKAGMGVASADLDADGDLDLLVCNLNTESDSVFENRGGSFHDATARVGLGRASRSFTRFGVGIVDFDLDGVLDLFQANGRVQRLSPRFSTDLYAEPNLLFHGAADGRFREVTPRVGAARTSRGAAFGDVDGDGAVDVLVVNRDAPVELLMNRVPRRGTAVVLRILDARGGPALGARVTAMVEGRKVRRDVATDGSYVSASAPDVILGLGSAPSASTVVVRWTDGFEERLGTLPAGSRRTVRRAD